VTLPVPQSLPDFTRMFPNEAACVAYLTRLRWPDGNVCGGGCGDANYSRYEGGRVVYCKTCGKKVNVTAGTIMHRSHTPLLTWFYAAFLVSTLTPGISAVQLGHQFGIREETAFQMLHKLRSAMVGVDRERLKGTIEADETYVGGVQHGGKGGRSTEGRTVVLGAVEVRTGTGGERHAGRLRLRVAPGARQSDIDPFFRDNVAKGAVVRTDGWDGYRHLRSMGYDHRPVVEGDPESASKVLPLVHREFSNLKDWLMGTHHGRVERKHLQAYVNEFCFRHNRRFWRFSTFQRLLQIGMTRRSPTYDDIYGAEEYGRDVHMNGHVPDAAGSE